VFIRGLAMAFDGATTAHGSMIKARTMSANTESKTIGELEVDAVSASVKGDHERAAGLMGQATKLEEALGPPSGPPEVIKPAHELFGEILLRAGKPEAAAEQFEVSLLRQPNRARSLLGKARAAAKIGDRTTAASTYKQFLEQWQQADQGLPELLEAQDYLKKVP
jgi:tetratricopeptide (TPR) repeat protein